MKICDKKMISKKFNWNNWKDFWKIEMKLCKLKNNYVTIFVSHRPIWKTIDIFQIKDIDKI